MFIDIPKQRRLNQKETIPALVLEHWNHMMPDGFEYRMDKQGNLVLASANKKMEIGGFEMENLPEFEEKLGKNPSQADILKYSYNAQKPIMLKPVREGFIKINGKDVEIAMVALDPFHKLEYVDTKVMAMPYPFPAVPDIELGCEQCSRSVKMRRIPCDSLDDMLLHSNPENSLHLKMIYNAQSKKATLDFDVKLANSTSIQDMLETMYIYNAAADGKITIDGHELALANETKEFKKISSGFICAMREAREVEKVLNNTLGISFLPPKADLDEKVLAILCELYQSLVEHEPVKRDRRTATISGDNTILSHINLDELIGQKIMFAYPERKHFELFGTSFDLESFNVILDAAIASYSDEGEQVTIFFENSGPSDNSYDATIDLVDEKSLNLYKKKTGDQLSDEFGSAALINDLVDAVLEGE